MEDDTVDDAGDSENEFFYSDQYDGPQDQVIFQEAERFEREEFEFKLIFKKRVSCTAHTLQLILHKLFDVKLPQNDVIGKTRRICKKFKCSHQATALLTKNGKKGVLFPGETR